ncbi:hypothetical protein BASA83_000540 [Batrachochytrium salamandrivorans]|nr:hypothetical protein BASA83_000540 [Batrachochytrium salamandrivorans]
MHFLSVVQQLLGKALSGPTRTAQNSTLRFLNLSGNAIMDTGLAVLASSIIKSLVGLHELHLMSNALTDSSAMLIAHLVASHPTLRTLNLQGNRFSAATVVAIDTVIRPSFELVNLIYSTPAIALRSNSVVNRSRIWWKPKHESKYTKLLQQGLTQSDQLQVLPLIRVLSWGGAGSA